MRALGNATATPRSANAIAMAAVRARHLLQNPHVLRQGDLPREVSDFFAGDAHPDLTAVAQWARAQGELDLLPFLAELGYCDVAAAPETIHPGNIDDLIDAIRTSGTDVAELSLPLSGHLATGCPHKLTTLLKLVDELPALASLQVRLVDCDPPSAEMRFALACSTACLTLAGTTVRPLIVGDLVLTDRNEQSLLKTFQNETNCADPASRIRFDVLAMVALKQGHEALLRALVQLSPGLTVTQYTVPSPEQARLLDKCGCGIAPVLQVTPESFPDTLAALRKTPWRWESIKLNVDKDLPDADTHTLALAAIQGAALTLAERQFSPSLHFASHSLYFVLKPKCLEGATWPRRQELAQLVISAPNDPQVVTDLATLTTQLRPRHLKLRCASPASVWTVLEAMSGSAGAAPVLEDLEVSSSGIDDTVDIPRLMAGVLAAFTRLRTVVVESTTRLDAASRAALRSAGEEILSLDGIRMTELMPNLQSPTTRIVFAPALRLRKGPFERAYHAGATARFFALLRLPADAGIHLAGMNLLDRKTQQALALVSPATSKAATDRRRELQAVLIAAALGDRALTRAVLREMLVSSTGTHDRALVNAIQQRLQAARDGAALAALNEALLR